jgi:HSP20 family protein
MNLKKFSPWNWLKKEGSSSDQDLPVIRRGEATGHPLVGLHQEIDRVFAQALRGFGLPGWPWETGTQSGLFQPSLDITENEKAYTIKVEMPGVHKDDVQVSVDGDSLIVRGEKREERVEEEEHYHYSERSYGSFQRVLALPGDADPDDLKAAFRDGILTITIGRKPNGDSGSRKIAIE